MRNKKLHLMTLIFVFTMALSYSNHCVAQIIYANGNIDKDSIRAGQHFDYKLDVRMPNGYTIIWPDLNDTIGQHIEVIEKGDITKAPIDNSNESLYSRTLKLTTFDTGYIEIPRIGVKYSKSANDTSLLSCYTEYIDIYVMPANSIDTTLAYRPIKQPIKQNITIEETLPYAAIAILLAGIVFLIILLIRRAKTKDQKDEEEVKPQIPAIIVAREKLMQLKESNLHLSGNSKEYYTDLTDIARVYLKGQFNIEATEMTSDKILESVSKINIEQNIFSKLQETLLTADLVKFAKASPNISQNEAAFNNINSFVEESYVLYQEEEKRKAEEIKAKKRDTITETDENQEMEETK